MMGHNEGGHQTNAIRVRRGNTQQMLIVLPEQPPCLAGRKGKPIALS